MLAPRLPSHCICCTRSRRTRMRVFYAAGDRRPCFIYIMVAAAAQFSVALELVQSRRLSCRLPVPCLRTRGGEMVSAPRFFRVCESNKSLFRDVTRYSYHVLARRGRAPPYEKSQNAVHGKRDAASQKTGRYFDEHGARCSCAPHMLQNGASVGHSLGLLGTSIRAQNA